MPEEKNNNLQEQNNELNLFDLTKSKDEHKITQSIPIQKPKDIPKKFTEVKKESIPQKIHPIPKQEQNEEVLPVSREEAQIGEIPVSQTSASPTEPKSETSEEKPEQSKQAKGSIVWLVIKIILFVLGSFIFVYLFLNFPALWKKLTYNYKEQTGQKPQVQQIIPAGTDEDLLFLSTVTLYDTPAKDGQKEVKKGPTKDDLGLSGLENNQLWIPKIDVKAPIIWDSPVDEATMMENLKYGVVHYKGTTKPGEKSEDGKGNVFISGHSSYYWWDDGNYKTVFVNLDQLENTDEIGIGYGDYGYVYKVYEKEVVTPNDTDVLKQDTDKHILSLMTCVPVGTNNKRLIVKAEFVARAKDEPEIIKEETKTEEKIQEQKPKTTIQPQTLPTQLPDIDAINLLPWNW